jgi:hypothetical protein
MREWVISSINLYLWLRQQVGVLKQRQTSKKVQPIAYISRFVSEAWRSAFLELSRISGAIHRKVPRVLPADDVLNP